MTVRIDNHDLGDIAQFSKLTTLKLDGCYRVSEQGIQKLAEGLAELESLNLHGCVVSDLSLHRITRHLGKLRELDVSAMTGTPTILTDSCLSSFSLLDKLETLSLSCQIGDDSRIQLKSLPALRGCSSLKELCVNVEKTELNESEEETKEEVLRDLRKLLPRCQIVINCQN
jgi:Leucine-rich repeat (LRR) protein